MHLSSYLIFLHIKGLHQQAWILVNMARLVLCVLALCASTFAVPITYEKCKFLN